MKEPTIQCSHTALLAPGDLKPHPRNPNTHPPQQIRLMARIIKAQGWRAPITISKRSGFITRGHGRLAAAFLLKCKAVPVDEQDYPDEETEIADMLADNKLASLATLDTDLVASCLRAIGDEKQELSGFNMDEILKLLDEQPPAVATSDLSEQLRHRCEVVVECEDEEHQRSVFDQLTSEGLKCRVLTF